MVAADHRSAHPGLPGLPWWAAVAVAVAASAIGFAFDASSGGKELTNAFAALYVLGCVTAVLVVRQSGVFTAVIQPPLILFFAVPGAYWVFHGGAFPSVKTIAINCGYPLIERFPLMLFTSAAVLLIGMCRWYFATTAAPATKRGTEPTADSAPSKVDKLAGKLSSALNRDATHAVQAAPERRRRAGERPRRAASRNAEAAPTAPARARHVRPPLDDAPQPRSERARRRRTASDRTEESARRRRTRDQADLPRQPREGRREPPPRDRGTSAGGRRDPYRPGEPEPPLRRRHEPKPTNGSAATHHPISRVRYRGAGRDEPDPQPRRPTGTRRDDADQWRYDR